MRPGNHHSGKQTSTPGARWNPYRRMRNARRRPRRNRRACRRSRRGPGKPRRGSHHQNRQGPRSRIGNQLHQPRNPRAQRRPRSIRPLQRRTVTWLHAIPASILARIVPRSIRTSRCRAVVTQSDSAIVAVGAIKGLTRQIAGCRLSHGMARSSCAATASSRSSRPWGATSWMPIGKPSLLMASGSEIDG